MVNLIAAPMGATRVVERLPHPIKVEPALRIPLPDGRALSARLWLPDDANLGAVPAVVEYAPFRHRDFTYPRDCVIHPWFAGHGYASLRLEPAGSQESDGVPMDEYVTAEQDDCVAALAWIADQPWCSGRTGMFGMSWGAFSALQVAARKPASLKAIIPVHGTDDRYNDDIHYKGGCMLSAGLAWGSLYQTYMMRPPDPDVAGSDWRSIWLERMAEAPDILTSWIGHHSRDDYWRHGSVCENYADIEAATYVICGWADGYTNAAVRMINGLTCPHRVLIGPWGHTYPHIALPGPQMGFLQEATRWWDRWLKDIENGVDQEPPVRIYMQGSVPPRPSYDNRDGRWITDTQWPLKHTCDETLILNRTSLDRSAKATEVVDICTPLANAIHGGEWLPHGVGPEMPPDQRLEDAGSLCFDTPVLEAPVEICGTPVARLLVRPDTETGTVCVRLSDIRPDGQSTLITYGLLDLTRHDNMAYPQRLKPGKWQLIDVPLNVIAQNVPAGHRLRLSVSTQSWPLTWPANETMTLSLKTGESSITLPVRETGAPDGFIPAFEEPAIPQNPAIKWSRNVNRERTVTHDVVSGEVSRTYVKDDGAYVVEEHGMMIDSVSTIRFSALGNDPLSARASFLYTIDFIRGDWTVGLKTDLEVSATEDHFVIQGQYRALEAGREVYTRNIHDRVPRF